MKPTIIATDKEHLGRLIREEIKLNGLNCDLNHIDVSLVKVMAHLFANSKFNGDISKWDTSNVVNMNDMFASSQFNGDISNWNVSKVKYMNYMFDYSKFNGDLSKWKVSKLEEAQFMFLESEFNQDLSDWKPLKLKNVEQMFLDCSAPIPYWAAYEDQEKRKSAINNYWLAKKLNKELPNNSKTSNKKIKI